MIERVIRWLYFEEGETLVKIKGFNTFLIDSRGKRRSTISPVWNMVRVKRILKRIFGMDDE